MTKDDPNNPVVAENRKARFDYHILETLECGMVLQGSEVKALRDGKVSLTEGYVRAISAYQAEKSRRDEPGLWLHSVSIGEYGPAGRAIGRGGGIGAGQHLMARPRKLLAHAREIAKLAVQVEQKGMTIVPLKIYFQRGYAKCLIGLAKGKAAHDKRQAIAERDAKREMARAMSKRDRS
ncbi:MAG: SsrA-binding protein SmpB [Planctomycetota bacterium]|nr:SsrA-binding protein SmpB [Planctomycetota bacterium]